MPIVQVRGYGPVEFPDSMSAEEIKRRVKYAEDAAPKIEFDPRALSLFEQFKGGAKRAASGIGSLVTDVVPAIGGSLFGMKITPVSRWQKPRKNEQPLNLNLQLLIGN